MASLSWICALTLVLCSSITAAPTPRSQNANYILGTLPCLRKHTQWHQCMVNLTLNSPPLNVTENGTKSALRCLHEGFLDLNNACNSSEEITDCIVDINLYLLDWIGDKVTCQPANHSKVDVPTFLNNTAHLVEKFNTMTANRQ